jgi:hypothetical protein
MHVFRLNFTFLIRLFPRNSFQNDIKTASNPLKATADSETAMFYINLFSNVLLIAVFTLMIIFFTGLVDLSALTGNYTYAWYK